MARPARLELTEEKKLRMSLILGEGSEFLYRVRGFAVCVSGNTCRVGREAGTISCKDITHSICLHGRCER